jgi:hypothetical protein
MLNVLTTPQGISYPQYTFICCPTHDLNLGLHLVNLIQRASLDEYNIRRGIRSRPQCGTACPAERSCNRLAGVCVLVCPCLSKLRTVSGGREHDARLRAYLGFTFDDVQVLSDALNVVRQHRVHLLTCLQ